MNVARHTVALRPFRRDEFGKGHAAPTEGHIRATNKLLTSVRRRLLKLSRKVNQAAADAARHPAPTKLRRAVKLKERAHYWVQATEQIWDHYLELFTQRQTAIGDWLLSCDRIALDCYQVAYLGLGKARSVPAPPPFSYMRRGRSPATFRKGIPLARLGKRINPFPLIQLPYHRLVNPWTLGAVLHEVCHNLQNDLGLAQAIPDQLVKQLLRAGIPPHVAMIWRRWNRESFADLGGLLLGGPAVVESLMDVVGRSRETVFGYSSRGPHPTPYLRTFLSVELLGRMGFRELAGQYRSHWLRIYGLPSAGIFPRGLLETFPQAVRLVVRTMCYQPYPSLGDKSLAQVIRFGPKEQAMIEQAAGRLATGTDPGILPERFFIGAARVALDRGQATPAVIANHFYKALARR